MKYRLEIVSPWVGSGTMEDSYRPQFGEDYTFITWSELSVRPAPDYLAAPNIGTLTCELGDLHRLTFADGDVIERFGPIDPDAYLKPIVSDVIILPVADILATLEADPDYLIISQEEVFDAVP